MLNSPEMMLRDKPFAASSGDRGTRDVSPQTSGGTSIPGIEVSEAKGRYIAILEHDLRMAAKDLQRHSGQIHLMTYTLSWQITRPLRWLYSLLQKLKPAKKPAPPVPAPSTRPLVSGVSLETRIPSPDETICDAKPPVSYADWIAMNDTLNELDRESIKARILRFKHRPVISLFLRAKGSAGVAAACATLRSLREQIYPSWNLVVLHDGDVSARALLDAAGSDSRIVPVALEEGGEEKHVLDWFIRETTGDYVSFLDAGSRLSEHALYLYAEEIAQRPGADIVYGDEDRINSRGDRFDPYFKPDWNSELFLETNYLGLACVYRKDAVLAAGGLRQELAGCDGWDLALRVAERSDPANIRHVAAVVLHRPEDHCAPETDAARRILASRLARTRSAATLEPARSPSGWRILHPLPSPLPRVTVIIPFRDQYAWLRRCLNSIFIQTNYPDFEIILIDNRSSCAKTRRFLRQLKTVPNVRIVPFNEEFNYSAVCNLGVRLATGDLVCLLNNDTEVITKNWLLELARQAVRPEIGAVGAMLYFPDSRIQQAGVLLGIGGDGVAGHAFSGFPKGTPAQRQRARCVQEFSAVTGACLMLRKEVYQRVGGMNETDLRIFYNDVDLCLRIRQSGMRILWTPKAELIHEEGATRGVADTHAKQQRFLREQDYMKRKWGDLLSADPSYNANFSLARWSFELASPTRFKKPWRA